MSRRIAFAELMSAHELPSTATPASVAAPKADDGDYEQVRSSPLAPSRRGRKALTVHVDLQTHVRAKIMAAREMTTLEALVIEALDLLFATRQDSSELASSDGRHAKQDKKMAGRAQGPAGESTAARRG